MSNAIIKYGRENFYIDQIDSAYSYSELNMKEVYWMEKLNTLSPNGYNLKTGGRNGKTSEETRGKISNSNKGMVVTTETRNKISLANTGKKRSDETKLKMSMIKMGNKSTAGRKISEEHKHKISLANTGRKHGLRKKRKPCTDEARLNMSKSKRVINNLGKKFLNYKGINILDTRTNKKYVSVSQFIREKNITYHHTISMFKNNILLKIK